MSREKGATYLDKLCHKFYDEPKGVGKKTDYVCRLCGGTLETYYCEERLYLVSCVDCGTLALVKATSPEAAAGVTLARPTLTPQNEVLTIEQLREMKDEPAYLKVFDPLLQSGWHIVKAVTADKIIFRGWENVYVPIDCLGVTYNLYRRPPEGEEEK